MLSFSSQKMRQQLKLATSVSGRSLDGRQAHECPNLKQGEEKGRANINLQLKPCDILTL